MLTVSYQVAFAWEEKENPKLLIPISHEDRVFGRAHRDICTMNLQQNSRDLHKTGSLISNCRKLISLWDKHVTH